MGKKTVIFDFDGTIVDSLETVVKIFNFHARDFGLPKLKKSEVENLRGMSYWQIIEKFQVPLIKIPFIITRVRSEIKNNLNEIALFPGIKETIHALKIKGYIIGMLTSNMEENVIIFLRKHQIKDFDFIHSESNIFGKGWALKKLLKKYKFRPEEVIYIGDEVRDIEACRENFIDSIAVTYGFNTREVLKRSHPTYLADKSTDILSIVTSI